MKLKLGLNTGDSGTARLITKEIKGKLQSIIFKSADLINIKIFIEKYPEIVLFDTRGIKGTFISHLRNSAITFDNRLKDKSYVEWFLEDKLVIEINGRKQTQVDLEIRWQ